MSEKFADKIKQTMERLRKEQALDSSKKPGRKIELFRENKDENTEKPVKH